MCLTRNVRVYYVSCSNTFYHYDVTLVRLLLYSFKIYTIILYNIIHYITNISIHYIGITYVINQRVQHIFP